MLRSRVLFFSHAVGTVSVARHTRSLAHSLTRSLAHSLTHSLTHSLARSLAREDSRARSLVLSLSCCLGGLTPSSLAHEASLACSRSPSLAHPRGLIHEDSFTRTDSLSHSVTQSLRHSVTQSLSHSVTQALSHSVTKSLSHSVTQSLSHSVTQSLSHSVTHTQLTHEDSRASASLTAVSVSFVFFVVLPSSFSSCFHVRGAFTAGLVC